MMKNVKCQIFIGIFFVFIFLCSTAIAGALLIFKIPSASAVSTCQLQPAANTNRRADGLISSAGDFVPGTIFGNPTGTCVIDPSAVIPPYQIYSYDDLKSIFYDQSKSVAKKASPLSTPVTAGTSFSGNGIWTTAANLTVSGSPGGNGTQVIFVPGDLLITSSVTYGTSASGLVFVVKGNINIDSTVAQINAVLLSGGTICTAYNSGNSTCLDGTVTTPQLIVNGSLISLTSTFPINFKRNLAGSNNTTAAEVINQQVKYLVILKDLFSLNPTYRIEDAIVPDTYPSLYNIGVNCGPDNNPASTGTQVYWSANVTPSGSYTYTWGGMRIFHRLTDLTHQR